ncbi:MAG: cold shock domain-containing protein [Candidatus Pacebacteria bacterium]|nr:cold shock domain-containing protein [Candidatus Paceibacterota bacterium]
MGKQFGKKKRPEHPPLDKAVEIIGIVTLWNGGKGYGFVQANADQPYTGQAFLHVTKLGDRDIDIGVGSPITCKVEPAKKIGDAPSVVHVREIGSRRATHKIKFFDKTKGFGFIENLGGGKDMFLHINAVERSNLDPSDLQEGTPVIILRTEDQPKGPAAYIIELAAVGADMVGAS